MQQTVDIVVIGAGVAGLTAAYRLQQAGRSVVVLEARDRVGGRAVSVPGTGLDLGPSWVWDSERHVHGLLRELGVATFPHPTEGLDVYDDGRRLQRGRLPRSVVAERRFVGGAGSLPGALAERVADVRLGTAVREVRLAEDGLDVDTDEGTWHARHVLAALPPALLAASVRLPGLDAATVARLRASPTWMADVAKVVVVYARPWWRAAGLSGRAASAVGTMTEIHDLCGVDGLPAALFGFVHRSAATAGWPDRIVPQLVRLFGPDAGSPTGVHHTAWWQERFTHAPGAPHGDVRGIGHAWLRQPLLDGRLHLISTETSQVSPGHLDGAVERAEAVVGALSALPVENWTGWTA